MTVVWQVSLLALWAVALLNLVLTLRLVRWVRMVLALERAGAGPGNYAELPIGEPAPDFRIRDLDGQPARLSDFAGHETVFVVVSPHCGKCRHELPTLVRLAAAGAERLGAVLLLVSDANPAETRLWLATATEQDGVAVPLRVLVGAGSRFLADYDPARLSPYFCALGPDGTVSARGAVDSQQWRALEERWTGRRTRPAAWVAARYR